MLNNSQSKSVAYRGAKRAKRPERHFQRGAALRNRGGKKGNRCFCSAVMISYDDEGKMPENLTFYGRRLKRVIRNFGENCWLND